MTYRTWNLLTGNAAFTLRLPKGKTYNHRESKEVPTEKLAIVAADLVAWSPVGDYYILAVEKTLMVYSVEVCFSIHIT